MAQHAPDLGDLIKSITDRIDTLERRAQITPGSSSLVIPAQVSANGGNFSIPFNDPTVVVTASIDVPEGYSQAIITAVTVLSVIIPSGIANGVGSRIFIDGDGSDIVTTPKIAAGDATGITNVYTVRHTGLTGPKITLQGSVYARQNQAVDGGNNINLYATAIFLR